MNVKNNARAKDSIEKIKEALKFFIKNGQSLHKISIRKLCEKAGVYRATFYAHFDVIDDVLYLIQKETLLKSFELLHDTTFHIEKRILDVIELLNDGGFTKQLFLNTQNIELKIAQILEHNDLFSLMNVKNNSQILIVNSIIASVVSVFKLYFLDEKKYSKDEIAKTILHVITINKINFPN